ncbi:molybdopterin molybdotransferase MoeA [Myceligenerans cantabricum]
MEPTPRSVSEHVARVLAMVAPLPAVEVGLVDLVDGAVGDGAVGGDPAGRGTAGEDVVESGVGPEPAWPTAPGHTSVLAEDVYAVVPVPPFDHSAMDGYAVRRADLPAGGEPVTLRVVADIAAAPSSPAELSPGTAARIMTGAPLPPGADAVVPVERTSTGRFDPAAEAGTAGPSEQPDGVPATYRPSPVPERATTAPAHGRTVREPDPSSGARVPGGTVTLSLEPRDHIRRRGADVAAGSLLAPAGTAVTAAIVAGLAAAGVSRVPVRRRPRVAVVATGSELVPAGSPTRPGQITDSNSLMLAAAVRAAGADVVRLGPVPDSPDALRETLDQVTGLRRDRGLAVEPSASTAPTSRDGDRAARVTAAADGQGRGRASRCAAPASADGGGVDLVVTAGGVSAGAADVVRAVLSAGTGAPGRGPVAAGAVAEPGDVTDVELAAVGMKPGRPQALARWRGVPWIAVPGTPVAAYVSFVMFVRPAVARLRGLPRTATDPESRPAASGWTSPRGREQVVPVRVLPDGVAPTGDGHHLSALVTADALAVVPAHVEKIRPGDQVPVIPL